ncbi:MAG TPA: hypothetical protein ENF24_02005 [Methanosarcinales archaeon]|nr:hypothetical protein [Methanosarcinales archaeon]
MKIEVITVPKEGETENGDAYFVSETEERITLAVIDGIGHGRDAHLASQMAVECLEKYCDRDLDYAVRKCHETLGKTRGAVLAIACITDCEIRFSGVGNIAAMGLSAGGIGESRFTSMSGVIGRNLKVVKTFSYPYREGDTIIMHSDGIRGLNITNYDISRDLRELGEAILSDNRVDDDSTILVAR